ncbi:putative endosome-associated ubiquitin isopeptidase [Saccharata proteae CBS 121410]|uniref:Endosome-associated ubiquitin isopeptidase n=1 Tax=Saccharata proteae CBS 121410 TaxID=1314787 RepID=A0A9P4LSH3_9PEZI|nr:putative endosome-associated ubiquitin isopeptidase [Saccharata proteae CBS 121410]
MANARVAEPLSVEEIVQQAGNFDYNVLVPLRYWLRSADTLLKEAAIYEREGNDQQAYLLLFRHATLVLDKLSRHPEAREPKNREALREANRILKQSLAKLEVMRPRINNRHERYLEYKKRRERERKERESQRGAAFGQDEIDGLSSHARGPSEPALDSSRQALDAGANRELAVKIAHKEIQRRNAAKKTVRFAGNVQQEGQELRNYGGASADLEEQALSGDGIRERVDDLSQRIAEAGRHVHSSYERRRLSKHDRSTPFRSEAYRYPSVPHQSTAATAATAATAPPRPAKSPLDGAESQSDLVPPGLPPKLPKKELMSEGLAPPPVPGKVLDSDTSEPPSRSDSVTPPQHDLSPKDYAFKPTAYLENGTPLRTVFISPNLRTRFLSIASPNTRNNLETCGILCGTLISNALFISRLVIPEQESTSDTCETVNESALFDYCDSEDLMVLGWIHTHPSQTCFMSSRDLHTHCGYQVMMPESIAIVCAPSKDPSWGVFRLTDPPGLKSILNCLNPGLFHPHAESNIYTDALKPGHVFEAPGLDFQVVDLRPGH